MKDEEFRLPVKILVLPGGIKPERQSDGAIGYDVCLRALVSPTEMEPDGVLRRCRFDFSKWPKDPNLQAKVKSATDDPTSAFPLGFALEPGEDVLGGIGFCTEMPPGWFFWVLPRSGLSSKYGIVVSNAPGTVDPDYRGEAGVIIHNRSKQPFLLTHGMRIAQIAFQQAIFANWQEISDPSMFSSSERGVGGFGSTGL